MPTHLRNHVMTSQAPPPWEGMSAEERDAAVKAAQTERDAAIEAAHAAYRTAVGSGYSVSPAALAEARQERSRAETAAWNRYYTAAWFAGRG